eukprot:GHVN01068843.1.p1 GENE.GHVN01068843.1~~GHVN01068843.1.p1  ORF type:complete len:103 (+),score=19.51 GHVN01068843.1:145-453(+)
MSLPFSHLPVWLITSLTLACTLTDTHQRRTAHSIINPTLDITKIFQTQFPILSGSPHIDCIFGVGSSFSHLASFRTSLTSLKSLHPPMSPSRPSWQYAYAYC